MSFNLTCQEFEPIQTPTSITFMILSFNEETHEPDGGWKGVYKRYVHWLEFCNQRGFNELSKRPAEQKEFDIDWKFKVIQTNLFYEAALESGGELHFDYI